MLVYQQQVTDYLHYVS